MEAQLPTEEVARLEALRRYRILDTPPESEFDEVVRLVAELCETPIALISLVDQHRQWFKGRYGLELTETPRRSSFCAHSILQAPALTEVPDTLEDPRFADSDLVTRGPRIRFYAAAPLVSREGQALGTLCVMDARPRHLKPKQKEALRVLARLVMMELELRRSVAELEQAANVAAAAHKEERTEQQALLWQRTAELARVQEESRRSAERFRTLAEAAFEGIVFVFQQQFRIVDCNEQFGTLLGYTRQELLERNLLEFLPPEEHEPVRQAARERWVGTLDLHLRCKDGTWRVIEAHGRYLAGADLHVGVMRDVTKRKEMEEALRRSEARFRTMANAMPQLAFIARPDGYVVWFNRRWYEYTGMQPEQAEGWGWQQVHDPQVLPVVLEQWRQSLASGEPFNRELPLRGADGVFHPFLTRVVPLKDEHGQMLWWFGTNTDIREIVAARQTLARSREELERLVRARTAQLAEANANLQNFAYTAAHDLRAPLRGIAGFSQLLAQQYRERLDEMGRSMLERVGESADQMSRLLNDLLEYSKITQCDLRLEKVNLEETVPEAVALLESDIRAKGADVSVARPLPEVIGHPATVIMLISNLLSNALKFMPEGVKPRVRLWAEPRVPRDPRGMVRLWVEDNGIGIAPEDQEKVFGAFQRLHGKDAYPGTGLGLAIVRKGVERMGGQVGLESEVGKGSRFWVELRSAD